MEGATQPAATAGPPALPLFAETGQWQMALGQRAALEGVLTQLRPQLALEIGTAFGGSLRRIAEHSVEVHSFDLAPQVDPDEFPGVTFHRGDSHMLLPQVLQQFAAAGRNVDFALVDGDHSRRGVREDLAHLLASPAVSRSIILLHDTGNDRCRAGIKEAGLDRHAKVVHVDLDFVPESKEVPLLTERWGGLGLVVVDSGQTNFRLFDESTLRPDRTTAGNAFAHQLAAPARRLRAGLRAARRRLPQPGR